MLLSKEEDVKMLNKEQKKYLRKLSHDISPIFQIGKYGLSDDLIIGIEDALEHRELIKVSVLNNNSDDRRELVFDLVRLSNAELVQEIGNTIILYKRSQNFHKIRL
jgi:RNA-binding protein